MASRKASNVISGNMGRVWATQKETWPVMACMGVAFGWMLYMGSRSLFSSPECLLTNRKARCSTIRPAEVAEAGEKWLAVRKPYIVKDISQIGVKVNEYKYRS